MTMKQEKKRIYLRAALALAALLVVLLALDNPVSYTHLRWA